jgi:hypothetical protein
VKWEGHPHMLPNPYSAARVKKPIAASMSFTLIVLPGSFTPKGERNHFGTGDQPELKERQFFVTASVT